MGALAAKLREPRRMAEFMKTFKSTPAGAGRERGDTKSRWDEVLSPYQESAANIGDTAALMTDVEHEHVH